MTIETGDRGTPGPVMFTINGHTVPFETVEGRTEPGQTFIGGLEINSFAHSLALSEPEKGEWDISQLKVDFNCQDYEPYSVTYGEVALDETTEVNIWKDPPLMFEEPLSSFTEG